MGWLETLERARDAGDLRGILLDHHLQFAPKTYKQIVIFGTASEGKRLEHLALQHNLDVVAVADDTTFGLRALLGISRKTHVVIASHRTLACQQLLFRRRFEYIAPFGLLQILLPEEYPPHPFYAGLLEDLIENREQYRKLYDSLADDRSRDVLDACLGYRMTMDPTVLEPIIDWDLYNPPNLINFGRQEVYVDAGAFAGDTVALFMERTHNEFSKVFAFEPDKTSFDKLSASYGSDPRFRLVNAGLHSGRYYKTFDDGGSRGSRFTDGAGSIAPVVSLDFILAGGKATFIKMNIEGDELEALDGSRGTIQRWAPRLAISAYHRPSDLWRVPQKIRELNPDYQIYLRQHDGGIVETVCYAL